MNYTCSTPREIPIPSQEFEQEESEGFVEPTTRKGTNFTQKDETVCMHGERLA
jgi:hypothetical protein